VDDVIVTELELGVPVSTEVVLLCVELVEVALVEELVDVALRVVVSSTGKNLATPRLVIGARSWAATVVLTARFPNRGKSTIRRKPTEKSRCILRNYVHTAFIISSKVCNYAM
jgi:hypothetical protein